jgi:hypothetical protein
MRPARSCHRQALIFFSGLACLPWLPRRQISGSRPEAHAIRPLFFKMLSGMARLSKGMYDT